MKRGSPLFRSTSLRRTPMKRRKRRARPGKDEARYLAFIRRQRCAWCGQPPPSDPHHRPGAGMGARSSDNEAVPMCRRCHDAITFFTGDFKTWKRDGRQSWHDSMVSIFRRRYAQQVAA